MKNKKGFTLAEVLITLVIIGIIAAITIPILMQNYKKQKYYTQFMKTYSTLNQAMNMSIAMGTFPSGFNYSEVEGSATNTQAFLDNHIKPYVKSIGSKSCFGKKSDAPIKDLTGKVMGTACQVQAALSASDSLVLSNGAVVAIIGSENHSTCVEMVVDTNGSKGPDVIGRDIHVLRYFGKANKPVITGNAHYGNSISGEITLDQGYYNTNCDPSKSSSRGTPGDTCADKLLQEGKMNY